ncbi:MAG TPA: hypothetical protein PLF51_16735, partial [Candidatus Hydrogenedentes bacterium]|nr:hypothetical protein [Candidatus Hydrogenedentota bacterium]
MRPFYTRADKRSRRLVWAICSAGVSPAFFPPVIYTGTVSEPEENPASENQQSMRAPDAIALYLEPHVDFHSRPSLKSL